MELLLPSRLHALPQAELVSVCRAQSMFCSSACFPPIGSSLSYKSSLSFREAGGARRAGARGERGTGGGGGEILVKRLCIWGEIRDIFACCKVPPTRGRGTGS